MIIVAAAAAAAAAKINNGSGFLGEHSERLVAWILSVLIKSLFNCPQKKKRKIFIQLVAIATRQLLCVGSDWKMQPVGDNL